MTYEDLKESIYESCCEKFEGLSSNLKEWLEESVSQFLEFRTKEELEQIFSETR